jgi:hypothetical protein
MSTETNTGRIGLMGVIGVAFIVLKLMDYIAWSWWLVLLPLYGPLTLVVVICLIILCVPLIKTLVK